MRNKITNIYKRVISVKFEQSAWLIFLLAAVPASIFFITIIPTSWGLDEQVHIARAYQISQGGIYPDKLPNSTNQYGGEIPRSLYDAIQNGWRTGNYSPEKDPGRNQPFYATDRRDLRADTQQDRLNHKPINDSHKVVYIFGATGPYAPIIYLPAAAGFVIGEATHLSVGTTLKLAKYLQCSIYLIGVTFALWVLRRKKASWILFTLALFPESIFQACTINADAYTNAAVFAFLAVLYKLYVNKTIASKRLTTALYITSLCVAFTKPSYAVALVGVLFIPYKALSHSRRTAWLHKVIILIISSVFFLVISIKGMAYSNAISVYMPPEIADRISLSGQLSFIVSNPIQFLRIFYHTILESMFDWQRTVVGLLGYNAVSIPYVLALPGLSALFIGILAVGKEIERRYSWILFAIGFLSAVSVALLLYLTFNTIGQDLIIGIQGRYFLPSLAIGGIGVGSLLGVRLVSTSRRTIPMIIVVGTIATLAGGVYVYTKALY